jgi:hypothetical protein
VTCRVVGLLAEAEVEPPEEFVFGKAGVGLGEPPQAARKRQRSRGTIKKDRFISKYLYIEYICKGKERGDP